MDIEGWINKKILDGEIRYFEYEKFSNFVEIGRGGFGKVSRAELNCMGLDVALKSSIDSGRSTFDENEANKLNLELVKEVGIYFLLTLYINVNLKCEINRTLLLSS